MQSSKKSKEGNYPVLTRMESLTASIWTIVIMIF